MGDSEMKKELKRAYKKLAKYEDKVQGLQETIESLRITNDIYKRSFNEAQTVLTDLKSALRQKDATKWYENRINDLEALLDAGVPSNSSYFMMIAQNKAFSKEVRELRLRVFGTVKRVIR